MLRLTVLLACVFSVMGLAEFRNRTPFVDYLAPTRRAVKIPPGSVLILKQDVQFENGKSFATLQNEEDPKLRCIVQRTGSPKESRLSKGTLLEVTQARFNGEHNIVYVPDFFEKKEIAGDVYYRLFTTLRVTSQTMDGSFTIECDKNFKIYWVNTVTGWSEKLVESRADEFNGYERTTPIYEKRSYPEAEIATEEDLEYFFTPILMN